MKLYVGNLSREINDAGLRNLVLPFGIPDSATVVTDRQTGQSRGFGFVELNNADEAKAAITGLNGTQVGEKSLIVNEARPRKG